MQKIQTPFAALVLAVTVYASEVRSQTYPPTYIEPGGASSICYAPHARTGEKVPVVGVNGYANGHWGFATYNPSGWPIIIFDLSLLSSLPRSVIRFTYYHECAHLQTPTQDEIIANCMALKQMRRNGDLSPSEEAEVERVTRAVGTLGPKYGGSGNALWDATLQCAGPR